MRTDDLRFAANAKRAYEQSYSRGPWMLILCLLCLMASLLIWAWWATVEEVTRGTGRVIPSSQLQVVQTLEAGIVREFLVSEGDTVEKDQPLIRIDDTEFSARLGEVRQRWLALGAEKVRLQAEANGLGELAFPAQLVADASDKVESERALFAARRQKRSEEIIILEQQLIQARQTLVELEARAERLKQSNKFSAEELKLSENLKKRGAIPTLELIKVRRLHAETAGQLAEVRARVPRERASVVEAEQRLANAAQTFRTEAREKLVKVRSDLSVVTETIKSASDRVRRTTLLAPLRGVVNRLNVSSVGAVVTPGKDIVEIVPLDESLLIEVQISPRDVAFIRPGQKANVKLSAYDYTVYGVISGNVERISADSSTDEDKQSFYRVIVRTKSNQIGPPEAQLSIIPGMVASVDILTGDHTILNYLLKPVRKIAGEAFRER